MIARRPASARVQQAAEKPVGTVIPRSRRRRGISHCHENAQSEILRSGLDDSFGGFFAACKALPFQLRGEKSCLALREYKGFQHVGTRLLIRGDEPEQVLSGNHPAKILAFVDDQQMVYRMFFH